MDAPLVSVLIPAYNAEATLGETLESLKGATFDGIVLKGRPGGHPLHRMVEYVRKTKRCRRDVLAMVSLDGRSLESFRSDVAALVSAGVQTISDRSTS